MDTSDSRSRTGILVAAVAIVALSLVATSSVLAAVWSYGPGLNPDSMNYVAGARSILAGEGFLGTHGTPLVYWPPFLSLVLAALGLTGVDLIRLGGVLNAMLFGGIVAASGFWLLRSCRRPALAVLGAAWVAASVPLFNVSCMLWSEPLFIFLTVLVLWQVQRCLEAPAKRALVVAGALVAMASMTRYIGAVLGVVGCLMILLGSKETVRKRLAACFLFGIVAAMPLTLWMLRNRALTGEFAGPRSPSHVGLLENVSRAGKGLALFFFSPGKAGAVPGVAWFGAAAVAALVLTALAARSRRRCEGAAGPTPAAGPLVFCAVYAGAIVFAMSTVDFTPLQGRYLSPLYAPGVLLVFFALDEVIGARRSERWSKRGRRFSVPALAFVAVGAVTVWWAADYGVWCARQVATAMEMGAGGYNSAPWRESETIAYLRDHRQPRPIYSNVPEALNKLTSGGNRLTPREKSAPGGAEVTAFIAACSRDGGATVVWFDSGRHKSLYGIRDLRRFVDLQLVARLGDGAVYHASVLPKAPLP